MYVSTYIDAVSDCFDIKNQKPNAPSGVYNITLWKSKRTIPVYCDMTTDKGGWTVGPLCYFLICVELTYAEPFYANC